MPGLTQTVDVPDDAVVYISTDGGVLSENPVAGTHAAYVDVAVNVDGIVARLHRLSLLSIPTAPATEYWSLASAHPLGPGVHTISVAARMNSAGSVTVSGNGALRSDLTVIVIKT